MHSCLSENVNVDVRLGKRVAWGNQRMSLQVLDDNTLGLRETVYLCLHWCTGSKKLLGTSASLVVTGALLVVTRS